MPAAGEFHRSIPRPKALLLCDQPEAGAAWAAALQGGLLEVIRAASEEEAYQLWAEHIPDLVVIDANTSRPDGVEICRRIRGEAAVPLLVLVEGCDEACVLEAYLAGADECIVKPVSPAVFRAKLGAWLRRSWTVPAEALSGLQVGDLRLDPRRRAVTIKGEKTVRLTNLEFRLLNLLMGNPGWTLEAGDLVERVWGSYGEGTLAMLKNLVYRLRRKIEPDPSNPRYLLTDAGLGYLIRGR